MSENLYYIQDTRSVVGNCALWWRKDDQGYTCDIDDAGVYTEKAMRLRTRDRMTDKPFPVEFVQSHIVRHVRVEPLRRYDPDQRPPPEEEG